MKSALVSFLLILLVITSFAVEQPKVAPPKEWRGIKLGAKYLDVEAQLKRSFSNIRKEGKETIMAQTEVADENVDVEFYFGESPKSLRLIDYRLTRTSMDTVLISFVSKYGAATSDTVFSTPFGPFRMISWKWSDPEFSIVLTENTNIYGVYGVSVNYSKGLHTESSVRQKSTTKKKAESGF